jgi:hypothetical protein
MTRTDEAIANTNEIVLNDEVQMPVLGFGMYQITGWGPRDLHRATPAHFRRR